MTLYTAAILVIGDEILSGRTHDTNSNFIAKKLIKNGIKLEEIRVIQDNSKIIEKSSSKGVKASNYPQKFEQQVEETKSQKI